MSGEKKAAWTPHALKEAGGQSAASPGWQSEYRGQETIGTGWIGYKLVGKKKAVETAITKRRSATDLFLFATSCILPISIICFSLYHTITISDTSTPPPLKCPQTGISEHTRVHWISNSSSIQRSLLQWENMFSKCLCTVHTFKSTIDSWIMLTSPPCLKNYQ